MVSISLGQLINWFFFCTQSSHSVVRISIYMKYLSVLEFLIAFVHGVGDFELSVKKTSLVWVSVSHVLQWRLILQTLLLYTCGLYCWKMFFWKFNFQTRAKTFTSIEWCRAPLPLRKICEFLILGEMSSWHFIKCQVISWPISLGTHRTPNIVEQHNLEICNFSLDENVHTLVFGESSANLEVPVF